MKKDLLFEKIKKYKKEDSDLLNQLLGEELKKMDRKMIVLDDDPTGVQTVHDISVYTNWDKNSILQGFQEKERLFFILTNSRGMTKEKSIQIHREIADVVHEVSKETEIPYLFISRSDSTLRGHYPDETQILKEEYEKYSDKKIDGEVLCPFFPEGERYTVGNIHYVEEGDELIPAGKTEFAKDPTFGYTSSSLPEYIEEKTKGKYKKEEVLCISLEEIRAFDFDKIEDTLLHMKDFQKVVVNAVEYDDLKVFCISLYRAMQKGKNFIFRSAAALVKVMGGISDRPLLAKQDMVGSNRINGGIIMVGSHTDKTSRQLDKLRELNKIEFIEFDASLVKDSIKFGQEIQRCLELEREYLDKGRTVCCYTTRRLITASTGDKEDELKLSITISDALCRLVTDLNRIPGFFIAKGGITSSDIGTKALHVKRATVLGQIKPGVPVWITGKESRFPGIPYVIFPGNVGEDATLKEIAELFLK